MRWSALSMERRRRIVADLARYLHAHPFPHLARWGVQSVGFGWRVHEREAGRVLRRSPVLVLVVPRKLRPNALAAERLIPRSLSVRHVIDGVEVTLNVPIDVCRAGPAVCAHSPRLTPQIAGGTRYGTACVILGDDTGKRWILSCHHVIGDSNIDPGLRPKAAIGLTVGNHIELGVGRRFGPLSPQGVDCVDAALARIVSRSPVDASIWTLYPSGYPDAFDYWEAAKAGPKLFCNGLIVPLRFLKVQFEWEVSYLGGARAWIREVALFEVTTSGSRPAGGDSGAPVLALDGRWLGMYIAGGLTTIDGIRRRAAVVIPPYVILEEPSLGDALDLVS